MLSNNNRYDLSQNLIHFFRSIDENSDNCPRLPEIFDWDSDEMREKPLSPFFLLRNAIRYGVLWAGWSHRKGKHTIYGNDSAVCFTEMPIPAFIEASLSRSEKEEAMSSYGLVFLKSKLLRLGTRKAIYGLDEPPRIHQDDYGRRFIDSQQLAPAEQYRFVSHYQSDESISDWTHEREWRWPLRNGQLYKSDKALEMNDFQGLDLNNPMLSQIGIIVKTTEQAKKIERDLLMKYDRGDVSLRHFSFLLALDTVESVELLKNPLILENKLTSSKVDLSPYLFMSKTESKEIRHFADMISKDIERATPIIPVKEKGGCWLWLTDNTHIATRAFLDTEHAHITKNGKYLVRNPHFKIPRDLRQREEMFQNFAEKLKDNFGVDCGFFSVSGSFDPNNVPFHHGASNTSHYMNCSYNSDDY